MIERAPEHFSIFTKKTPWWDKYLDLPSFVLNTSLAGCSGYAAAKFGNAAFEHPQAHGSFTVSVVAGMMFILATFCAAIAGKKACRIAGV
jgi:hypothetical protein